MNFKIKYFLILILFFGCNSSDPEEIIEYYESGNMKSKGSFIDGLRVDKHFRYFDSDERKIEYEVDFEIVDNESRMKTKRKYHETGQLMVDSKLANKQLNFSVKDNKLNPYDTINLIIHIPKMQNEYIGVTWGAIKENLFNENDGGEGVFFAYDFGDSIEIQVVPLNNGENIVRGYVSDFTIVQFNDSLGYTKSIDIPFEYKYFAE